MAKATQSREQKHQLQVLLTKIEHYKERMAKERDDLRATFEEVETLLESWDRGIENIESGLNEIRCGIDAISERV